MRPGKEKNAGSLNAWFPATQWTGIAAVRTLDSGRQREAMNAILQEYWKPVYA